eukprot:m51a1_g7278 putative myb domain-containing protein (631) ;mRNA; r:5111-7480
MDPAMPDDVDFIEVFTYDHEQSLPLLAAAPAGFDGPQILASPSGYPNRILRPLTDRTPVPEFEPWRRHGSTPPPSSSADDVDGDDAKQRADDEEFKRKFKRHKVPVNSDDHYDVLGLGTLRWKATPEQIRIAYRQLSLKYHPDKCKDGDEIFKRVNKAYEVLSNPEQRQIFDSTETFDDRIPSEREAEEGDFFSTFAPVFERNQRWSSVERVPELGDMWTPWDDVVAFYDFWYSFKSWREFPLEDQYDPNDAESREEKRWMQRQNDKMKSKLKKEESARVRRLVDLAYRKDPRIAKHERDIQRAKEQRKQERHEEQLRKEEKELQRRERLQKQELSREALEKKKLEDEIKHANALRAKLRAVAKACGEAAQALGLPVAEQCEVLCSHMTVPQLDQIVQKLAKVQGEAAAKLIVERAQAILDDEARKRKETEEKALKEKEEKLKASSRPWTVDELALLSKAIQRFPGGCHERWQKISAFIGTRSMEEVIEKHKTLKSRDAHGVVTTSAYDVMKDKIKEKAIDSPLDKDWTRVNKDAPSVTVIKKPETAPAAAAAAAPAAGHKEYPASVKDWTPAQQKQLEAGLKEFKGKDKWEKIVVEGKTKEDCVARFAYLKDILTHKKQAAAAAAAPKK